MREYRRLSVALRNLTICCTAPGPPVTDLTEILGSVNQDPLVANTALYDLHLTTGSPASQAGSVIGGLAVFGIDNTGRDHDGLPRPAIPAIGAYELPDTTAAYTFDVKSATAGQIEPFAAGFDRLGVRRQSGRRHRPGESAAGNHAGWHDGNSDRCAGVARAALLFYVSPTQINWEIPDGAAPGTATVTIANVSGTSQSGSIQIGAVSPGLFELNASGLAAAWVLPVISGAAQNPQAVYQLNSTGGGSLAD
jgi:hypothetical protein